MILPHECSKEHPALQQKKLHVWSLFFSILLKLPKYSSQMNSNSVCLLTQLGHYYITLGQMPLPRSRFLGWSHINNHRLDILNTLPD